jgi:hypothetical protein
MGENNEFPFPQADNFDKIVSIVNIQDIDKLKDKRALGAALGDITERQVQYYISACQYLGLIDADKNFTDKGDYIRSLGESKQFVEFAKLIVSQDVFGDVYFSEKNLGCKFTREEVIEIMHDRKLGFESEEMYKRRAQTVVKWVEWVNQKFDQPS